MDSHEFYGKTTSKELAASQRLQLKGFDDPVIEAMVDYLYGAWTVEDWLEDHYPTPHGSEACIKAWIEFVAGVYRLSKVYNVEGLCQATVQSVRPWMRRLPNHQLNAINVTEIILDGINIKDYPGEIHDQIFRTLAERGRDTLCQKNIERLMDNYPTFAKNVVRQIMDVVPPEFAKSGGEFRGEDV